MGTAMIVATVVSIVATVISSLTGAYQIGIQHYSSKVRQTVKDLMRVMNSELRSGRLSVNRILALLQNRNQNALISYLTNNPIISKKLSEINKDSELIASLQAEQAALEQDITNLQNELNQMGYGTTLTASYQDEQRIKEINDEIGRKAKEYEKLSEKYNTGNFSTVKTAAINTGDLDARSQNITGGLVK